MFLFCQGKKKDKEPCKQATDKVDAQSFKRYARKPSNQISNLNILSLNCVKHNRSAFKWFIFVYLIKLTDGR